MRARLADCKRLLGTLVSIPQAIVDCVCPEAELCLIATSACEKKIAHMTILNPNMLHTWLLSNQKCKCKSQIKHVNFPGERLNVSFEQFTCYTPFPMIGKRCSPRTRTL